MTEVIRLLKSWAMPPANVPIDSSLSALASAISALIFSEMSRNTNTLPIASSFSPLKVVKLYSISQLRPLGFRVSFLNGPPEADRCDRVPLACREDRRPP